VTGVQEKTDLTREQSDEALQRFTDGFISSLRAPVLHWPSEVGLEYEDVTFPARDGVPLEGWFIPAAGSAKLIIANHPFSFSRSGIPTHVEPWHTIWAPSGNGFELNLVPDYKILHDAGYNVLTYDLRNHGLSGAANGRVVTNGVTESRDVAGSLDYARERFGAREMAVGLFSRCTGGELHVLRDGPLARGVRRRALPRVAPADHHRDHHPAPHGRVRHRRPLRRLHVHCPAAHQHRARATRPPGVGQERPRAYFPLRRP